MIPASRARPLGLVVACAWLAACGGAPRPNVLLVCVDTLRADAVGSLGGPIPTPGMDELARQGVRFMNAIAPAPETAPSHATLFTGRAVAHHGVTRNGARLPEAAPTLAEAFARAGYATAGFVSSFVLDPRFGWARGFDVYDARFPKRGETVKNRRGFWSRHDFEGFDRRAAATNAAAAAWLRQASEPFFLFVHYFDPHAPYAAAPEHLQRVPRAIADAAARRRAGRPGRGRLPGLAALRAALRHYHAEALAADVALAELLAVLQARGAGARTVVALVADHGEGLGEHGLMDHAAHVYEEQVRVPWLLRWPGELPAGAVLATPVGLADVAPTLADLAGVAFSGTDGRSLAAWLRAGREPAPRPLVGRRRHYPRPFQGQLGAKHFVRTDRFKYIRSSHGPNELYDLAADPAERRNLHAERPATVAELSAVLDEHLRAHAGPEAPLLPGDEVRRGLGALGYGVD